MLTVRTVSLTMLWSNIFGLVLVIKPPIAPFSFPAAELQNIG